MSLPLSTRDGVYLLTRGTGYETEYSQPSDIFPLAICDNRIWMIGQSFLIMPVLIAREKSMCI